MALYYRQRVSAGFLTTEGALISPQGSVMPLAPQLDSHDHMLGWKKIVDGVHAAGGTIFCQLWHRENPYQTWANATAGRLASNIKERQKVAGKPVQGPSAIQARYGEMVGLGKIAIAPSDRHHAEYYSKPVEIANPKTIVAEYVRAAKLAKEAGFDGIELHAANGYLIPAVSTRTFTLLISTVSLFHCQSTNRRIW